MKRFISITMAICALVASYTMASASSLGLNVMDFGAKADGKADDTAAIQKAITEGAKKKLPVVFPRGDYRVTKPLSITNQSIMGNEPGAWPTDSAPMPKILVDHVAGPAITMNEGSSVHGLYFAYDAKSTKKFPATLQLAGVGLSITNVRISSCTDGIVSDGKNNLGRLNIENVFMLSPKNLGLYVTNAYDIPTIRNVEVWNNEHVEGATAFKFGRVDGLRGSHLVAFGVDVAFDLADDPAGGVWGVFVDCGTDACVVAWRAVGEKSHDVAITGGFFWDHQQTFLLDNPNAGLRVSNAELMSNGSPIVDCIRCGTLMINGCRFARAYLNAETPYVDVKSANVFLVNGSTITPNGPGFVIGSGLKQASITGNVFEPSTLARILKDERSPNAEITIANNTGMTPLAAKK